MKMKVAVYKDIESNYTACREVFDYLEKSSSYVRMTEIVEIDFPDRDNSLVVDAQVECLKKAAAAIEAKAYDAVQNINARINELLALPAPASV